MGPLGNIQSGGMSSGSTGKSSLMGKITISEYIDYVENQKEKIRKNYEDMDLENSELNTKFEEIVERMEKKCDDLISKISSYTL